MVYTCYLCKWRSDEYPRRSYHRFPSNRNMKQKWLNIIGKSEATIGQLTSLCGVHFEEDCFYDELFEGNKILKDDSLPTLHLGNIVKQKQKIMWSCVQGLTSESSKESGTGDEQMKDSTCESNIEDNRVNPSTLEIHVREHCVGVPISCPPSERPTQSGDGHPAKAEILRLKKKVLKFKSSIKILRNSKSRIDSHMELLKKRIKNYEVQIYNLKQLVKNNGNGQK